MGPVRGDAADQAKGCKLRERGRGWRVLSCPTLSKPDLQLLIHESNTAAW